MDLDHILSRKQKKEIIDKKIRDLAKRGFTYAQMSKALNVSKTTIVSALFTNRKNRHLMPD